MEAAVWYYGFLFAQALTIGGGTGAVQRNIVGERVLGLPHGLAVLHGKTRRGGLVFDVADLVKDAHILPQAFVSAMRGDDEAAFRRACIEQLTQTEALDFMIDQIKEIAIATGRLAT
jgi:CRISPR-associated protein Cas1